MDYKSKCKAQTYENLRSQHNLRDLELGRVLLHEIKNIIH